MSSLVVRVDRQYILKAGNTFLVGVYHRTKPQPGLLMPFIEAEHLQELLATRRFVPSTDGGNTFLVQLLNIWLSHWFLHSMCNFTVLIIFPGVGLLPWPRCR